MIYIGRWGLLFAGALTMLCAVLVAPSIQDPGHHPGGGVFVTASVLDVSPLDRAELGATIAFLEAIDVAPRHPAAGAWSIAASAGDGLTLTDRLNAIQQGGRVKSAASLLVSPASRWSARV